MSKSVQLISNIVIPTGMVALRTYSNFSFIPFRNMQVNILRLPIFHFPTFQGTVGSYPKPSLQVVGTITFFTS